MDIVRDNVDDLNAVLTVKVQPEDYQKQYNTTLSNYKKQANIPGFRPGKIPMGVIKKRFGKSVLAEEMNKVINEGIHGYIADNNIDILGNPLPKEDAEIKGDWDNPSDFEFKYEIGLAPAFDVKLSGKNKYTYYKVKVDDALIDKQANDLARRYGKLEEAEKSTENCMLFGQFVELNDDESIKEGGIMNSSTISVEFLEDKKAQKKLIGKKVGDEVIIDPRDVSRGDSDLASMLNIKEEEVADISNKFKYTISEVKELKPAELNKELFDKLFGEGEVNDEKEFRARIKADLENMFEKDSERILSRDVADDLMKKIEFKLPDEFLKRWILISTQNEDLTAAKVEEDYNNYQEGLKWQLIQNKILKENEIKVEPAEAVEFTKSLLVRQYAQYGMPAPEDKELEASAKQVLQNQEEAQRIYDQIYDEKLLKYFKETVGLKEKAVDYDKFVEIAQQQ